MASIAISRFQGCAKGISPRLIPEGFARNTVNSDVSEGSLRPAAGVASSNEVVNTPLARSLYRYPNGKWLTWMYDVDVVRSPLVEDKWGRIYWTGQANPKMAAANHATSGSAPYPNAWYSLGVPAPDMAPGVEGATPVVEEEEPATTEPDAEGETPTEEEVESATTAPDAEGATPAKEGEEPATAVTVVYAFAYVTEYEEVGPLSMPSNAVTRWDDGGDVTLTLPSINAHGRNIVKLRIFRSETGGGYLFVADVPAGTSSFTDTVASEDLGIAANSISFDPPPDELSGLIAGPGGSLYGFQRNVLCASEPGYPHAWPTEYRLAFQDDIVGIAESAIGIVVATKGAPWVVSGATPAALNPIKIETREPCVSKRSVVDMGDYVIYASPNGLVSVGTQGADLISKALMSRAEWNQLNPDSIHAYRDRDRYLAFFVDQQNKNRCFTFSPDRGFEFIDIKAYGGYYVGELDTLFLFDGSDSLQKWGEGDAKALSWRSGIYETPLSTSFTCAKVIADQYPVQLTLYADGEQAVSHTVQSTAMFRLPAGVNAREWEIELSGLHEIFSVQIAQSPQELI